MRRERVAWRSGSALAMLLALGATAIPPARAHDAPAKAGELGDLSLEELGEITVTSVSRREEPLLEAAAAVFVITRDDIRRSGAATLPDVLRMAPNLEVARQGTSQQAITARGFNSINANKLLVLIDGRSVYTPLFSGVLWDAQDLLLQDVERIEVISGPGGTLWGSNAVNGVINIITRSAADTIGSLVTARLGTSGNALGFRHGGRFGEGDAWRIHARGIARDPTALEAGGDSQDALRHALAGFRLDGTTAKSSWMLDGEVDRDQFDQPVPADEHASGEHLLGRWEQGTKSGGALRLQGFFDRTRRREKDVLSDERSTLDFEADHRLPRLGRHEVVWGGGLRGWSDDVHHATTLTFFPERRRFLLWSLFVQDRVSLAADRVALTFGVKAEHHDYVGLELQPNVRVGWRISNRHSFWAAVSRAVRTPSRFDRDFYFPAAPPFIVAGGAGFRSETLLAHEAGWRHDGDRASVSVSAFFNRYERLRTLEPDPAAGGLVFENRMEGETWGLESWAEIRATPSWRLVPGYAFMHQDLRLLAGSVNPRGVASEGNSPRHRVSLRSLFDIGDDVELNVMLRHVSALPDPAVPAYTELDLCLTWRPRPPLELSLVGTDLLHSQHAEFGPEATRGLIRRAVAVQLTWSF